MDYQYAPLDNERHQIRLITLLPGSYTESLSFSIWHASLEPPEPSIIKRWSIGELQKSLPPSWEAHETNAPGSRIIFYHPQSGESSWAHPDRSTDPSMYQPLTDLPPADYEPAYEALSYAWGAQTERKSAILVPTCDEPSMRGPIRLGQNLASAMKHLRYPHSARTLWVDAICINQRDHLERAQQVARMNHVYSLARRVVIWLGPAGNGSRQALSTLSQLGGQIAVSASKIFALPTATERDWVARDKRLPYDQQTWQSITNLLNRQWFSRLWVWQEAQLANSSAIVVCGLDQMPWRFLASAIDFIRHNYYLPSSELRNRAASCAYVTMDPASISTSQLLEVGRSLRCSDPRDKIYGIINVTESFLRRKIIPDYDQHKRAVDVYRDVFRAHVETTKRLDLLIACENRRFESVCLPSWVPRYDSDSHTSFSTMFGAPAGVSSCEVTFGDNDSLQAAGIYCKTLGKPRTGVPYHNGEAIKVLHQLQTEISSGPQLHPETTPQESYLRSLLFGQIKDLWPKQGIPLDQWREQFLTAMHRLKSEKIAQVTNEDAMHTCLRRVQGTCFITDERGLMGWGPPGVKKGDVVCVLLGCNSPIVIRKASPNRYQVVGACYFEGLSDASALLGPLDPQWQLQLFRHRGSTTHVSARFYNTETNLTTAQDPRLPPLGPEWHSFDRNPTPDDPAVFRMFHNTVTGELRNSDPRMTSAALRDRGIDVQMIELM